MSYADYEFYSGIYDEIPAAEYDRYAWEADRILDRETTGVDNVRKLAVAMPTDTYYLECVQRCACAVANALYKIDQLQTQAGAYITRSDGTVTSAVVSSVSSGSESISYATNTTGTNAISAAASSDEAKAEYLRGIVRTYLSGVEDANGVNLLYMGRYPYVL